MLTHTQATNNDSVTTTQLSNFYIRLRSKSTLAQRAAKQPTFDRDAAVLCATREATQRSDHFWRQFATRTSDGDRVSQRERQRESGAIQLHA